MDEIIFLMERDDSFLPILCRMYVVLLVCTAR